MSMTPKRITWGQALAAAALGAALAAVARLAGVL